MSSAEHRTTYIQGLSVKLEFVLCHCWSPARPAGSTQVPTRGLELKGSGQIIASTQPPVPTAHWFDDVNVAWCRKAERRPGGPGRYGLGASAGRASAVSGAAQANRCC